MILIKAAYYLRNLPTMIAIVLPDDAVKVADLTPFRNIKETEMRNLAVFDLFPACRKEMLKDEIPDYVLRFYGLKKLT